MPATTGPTVATSVVNVKCKGNNTGSATVTATGTAPYTYTWSTLPVQTTATATGLTAGTYSITVKDANGTTTASVIVTEPATAITASVTTTNANCGSANGTASVNANGGTGGYTYLWSNSKTTSSISGLSANIYSVVVTDANGCTFTGTANVLNTGAPTVNTTPVNASTCSASDGSISSNVSGGAPPYSYLWSNNKTTTTITGLPVGNYTLTVTDAVGCIKATVATVSCTVTGTTDAGVASIGNPTGIICGTSFYPTVSIKNFGTAVLTSCTILYRVDANPNQTFNWSGALATGASANVNLPSISTSMGMHTFYSSTSNPNGASDVNTANDQSQSSFNITNTAAALPLMEGFESGPSLPMGWTLDNPNLDASWEINTTVAHTGNNCIGFNNCNGNGAGVDMKGTKDRLITSAYDFTSATASASLSFDVGYAVLFYKGQMYPDSLAVFASTDCGLTWSQIYLKGGTDLSPITTPLSCWTPSSADWRTDKITLNNLAGKSHVMFAFENRSGWGEWIYLDNINITAITGVSDINPLSGFSIYPNPSSTAFTIEGSGNTGMVYYSIYNVVGAEVRTGLIELNSNGFKGKLQVSDTPKGMYFIRISDGKNTCTKKLSIQ